MKLYVCYGTFRSPRQGGHPCGNAYRALRDAGHDPKVKRAYGLGPLPGFLQSPTRHEIKRRTGSFWAPVLVTDDDEWISGSKGVIAWAEQHPASAAG